MERFCSHHSLKLLDERALDLLMLVSLVEIAEFYAQIRPLVKNICRLFRSIFQL